MYYAITINDDGLITGRHESAIEITDELFARGAYAGQELRPVPDTAQYRAGYYMSEYDDDGVLRPLIDRIMDGLRDIPQGYELIDGELVETQVPETESPPRLMERVMAAEQAAQNSRPEEAKAVRVLFRALAKSDTITPDQALENKTMFEGWNERIGTQAEPGEYLRYDNSLYRVQQAHTIQEHYPPSVHTAALYTRVQEPNAGPEPWQNEQSYAKGVEVTHNGGVWLSGVDNNVWEPGAAGVFDNIWKRVRDA